MKKNKLFKYLQFDPDVYNQPTLDKQRHNSSKRIIKNKNISSISHSATNNELLLSFNSSSNKQLVKSQYLDSGQALYPDMSMISNIPNLNNNKLNNSLKNTMLVQGYLNKV